MKKIFILILVVFTIAACKKDEPAAKDDLYPDQPISTPSSTAIGTFHQSVSFYQLFVYRFDPVKINADKVLQFFPDFDGAKTGIVKVVAQDITLTRSNLTSFKIGISGSGTYNENTKLIDLEVKFNESAIGGTSQTFNYKMSPVALTLN